MGPRGLARGRPRREIEILHLIASGLNTKDTALRLHVSPATVRNHVQNILGKLGSTAGSRRWPTRTGTA